MFFSCIPCNRRFVDDRALKSHLIHASVHNYCELCRRDFRLPQSLQQHLSNAAIHQSSPVSGRTYEGYSSGRGGWHLDYNDNGTDLSDGYSGYSDDYNSDESEDTFQPLLENNGYNRTNIPNISNRIEEIIHHSFWRTPLEQSFRDANSDGNNRTSLADRVESSGSGQNSSMSGNHSRDSLEIVSLTCSTRTPNMDWRRRAESNTADTIPVTRVSPSNPVIQHPRMSTSTVIDTPISSVNSYMCPLCFETNKELSSVACGHLFCTLCIRNALDIKRECPICRSVAHPRDVRRIYLNP